MTATPHRPAVCGGETPAAPYPVYLQGIVEHGFGRGSKDLNCPTANLPVTSLNTTQHLGPLDQTGVYFGFAQVRLAEDAPSDDRKVHPMVMSVGWNPHYKNKEKSVEVHILHPYADDFYGKEMRVVILGYIRPEQDYKSLGTSFC